MANELKMKKLMTVSKSKYYMLKVNYSKVFEQIESEDASLAFDAAHEDQDRLNKDLDRNQTINTDHAASEK